MEFILSLFLMLSPPVEWPVNQQPVPVPPPVPAPNTPIFVPPGYLFVVTSEVPGTLIPSVEGKVKVTVKHGPFDVYARFVGGSGRFETRTFSQKNVFIVEPIEQLGTVDAIVVTGDLDKPQVDRRTLKLGDEPKPPDPKPPEPTPSPAPIAAEGLHVLWVVETSDAAKLPPKQVAVLTASAVREYLDNHCPKVNGTPQYRIWDKDVDTRNESQLWRDAFARKRSGVPWLLISNGKAGYEGPPPGTVEETLTLLKKYGGQ